MRVGSCETLPESVPASISEPLRNAAALHFLHRVLNGRVLAAVWPRTATVSPDRTGYDGISTFFPFTVKCPWRTSWRACGRDVAKPSR